LLEHLCGVDVRLVSGADLEGVRRQQELLAKELSARGRRPAIITLTREVYVLSALAYATFTVELMDQLRDLGIGVDALYVGSGGATYAGMLLGSLALRRPFRVVGFTPTGSAVSQRKYVVDLLHDAIRWLGQELTVPQDAIEIFDDYVGKALNVPVSDAVQAIRLAASTEGIFLDPVYSSRAMAGLVKHARCNQLDNRNVVFVHTGGLPSLFAFAASLSPTQ